MPKPEEASGGCISSLCNGIKRGMEPDQSQDQSKTPNETEHESDCDVLVIGGGPAGSTIGGLLAEQGWRVVLLEKDHHPRFHIGESLLPMNLPIFQRLGVLDQVRGIGVVKPGIELCSDRQPGRSQTLYFERALNPAASHAFEVPRAKLDELLLRNCAKRGVAVHEGVKVTEVARENKDTSLVRAKDGDAAARVWRARFVVDASGRNAFLSTRMGFKQKNERHNSVAIFGHFKDVERRSGPDEGNIGLYWFKHGWFWMIPLPDGVMSVGAVCWPDYLKTRDSDLERFLWDTIALCPGVQERMRAATLIGPARSAGNYSYRSARMWDDGYVLVGDAYGFIDPVFSSGVYLAMTSAEMGAEAVDVYLRDGVKAATPKFRAFERRLDKGLRLWSWFIYRFTTPAMHDLFLAPRNILGMEQAILSVLAGDVFGRTRTTIPIALFKTIYYVASARSWLRSWASYRRRKQNIHIDVLDNKAAL